MHHPVMAMGCELVSVESRALAFVLAGFVLGVAVGLVLAAIAVLAGLAIALAGSAG